MQTPTRFAQAAFMMPLVLAAALACADAASPSAPPSLSHATVSAARVEASPDYFSLRPGASRRASAVVTLADGRSIRHDTLVRWSSLDPAVATVSGASVTGVGYGKARLAVQSGARVDTLQVLVTDAPVASVSLGRTALLLAPTRFTYLYPSLRDSAGNLLVDRRLGWTTSDEAVAKLQSPASNGVGVVAVAPGTATITATSEGRTATLIVTVGSAIATTECETPRAGWIFCDDFELDRRASYFERDSAGGRFVRATAVGANGSYGMRARFDSGLVSAGSIKIAFGRRPSAYFKPVDAGTAVHREVYWRWYVRYEPEWTGGGGSKMSRATSFAAASWAQSMIAHVWAGSSPPNSEYLYVDPASGTDSAGTLLTTKYNDFDHLRWLGAVRGAAPLFRTPMLGQWHCVEAHAKLNDAGASNGVFELWVNGTLDAQRTGLSWLGSFAEYGINAVMLENYWNSGSPKRQERYFDNFVVSTQRIGC